MATKETVMQWDTLMARFWKDFSIPVQEEDSSVNFANPSDVVRSLVKSRNWMGTISENLINIDRELTKEQRHYNVLEESLRHVFIQKLATNTLSGIAVKNKETQEAFVLTHCSDDEKVWISESKYDLQGQRAKIDHLKHLKNSFELMKRALEKTTDWLVQYLNWHKFEIRERV